MKALYGLTVALSAALLFSVEPMVTRTLLPQLGGSSAVWLTALAFFQFVLLLGYAYTTWVTRFRLAWAVHLALLTLSAASLLLSTHAVLASGSPQLRIFFLLTATIGLPFLTLSTTAPLMQAWYAQRERSPVPYRLFGLSNLASLAALLAYPTLIEPHSPLNSQWLAWKLLFLSYLILTAGLTLRMRSAPAISPAIALPPAPLPHRTTLFWLLLPACASLQLAAVTSHLTQDIASLPLLWVVPLAAYLLSFVLAFEFPNLYSRSLLLRLLAVLLFSLGYFLTQIGFNVPIGISVLFFSAELFVASWFCHAELFALRPQDSTLSPRFYLYIAAGGVLGTLLVAVVSPLVTSMNLDLPFSFLATAALILAVTWPDGWQQRALWSAATALGVVLLADMHLAYTQDALFTARNFYGSIRVKQTQVPPQAFLSRTLYNGAIQHGMQWFSPEFHHTPLTYYAPDSGIGLALTHGDAPSTPAKPRRIGVIGLGAGTLAAYGHPGDQFRFYEINPIVTTVAQHLFTYTRDTPATVTIVPGDARLSLAAEAPQHFDVLVVDAFSGDSIPTHLLTREALALYLRHLAPGGILAFHISNQHLDLAPVLARITTASDHPLFAREITSAADDSRGEALTSWVLIAGDSALFDAAAFAKAHPISTQSNVALWTDQYSSLLPILRWAGRH